jgi:hypothetical protein
VLLLLLLLLLQDSPASLTRALRWTYITGGTLTLVLVVAWPLLALPAGVFSKGYFTMWIIIAMIWGLLASGEILHKTVHLQCALLSRIAVACYHVCSAMKRVRNHTCFT